MNRQQKSQCIEQLQKAFLDSGATFLVNYRGLTVPEMEGLRNQLRQVNARMWVVKGRLAKRAATATDGAAVLEPYLQEQIALVFSGSDFISETAKVLATFSKKSEELTLSVGIMDSSLLSEADVKRLALLPSREILLSQLAGVLQAPMANMARAMSMVLLKCAWAFSELQKKKGQEA